jgi:hypothetical protein
MNKILIVLVTGCLVFATGCSNGDAQEEAAAPNPVAPVELYICNYNEGMGPTDMDAAVADWNAWADEAALKDYTAWTLTKYYFGSDQDFDVIWLGTAPDAKALGRGQDNQAANGAEVDAGFAKVVDCGAHSNFAAVQFKAPPDNDDPPSNIVLGFSDCKIAEGKNFQKDVAPAITAWTEFRTDHGSEAGHWILFPAYGGGGEEFDFKWVTSFANHEAMGGDWDQYDGALDSKLFDGLLSCDSERVYNAANRRRAADDQG